MKILPPRQMNLIEMMMRMMMRKMNLLPKGGGFKRTSSLKKPLAVKLLFWRRLQRRCWSANAGDSKEDSDAYWPRSSRD